MIFDVLLHNRIFQAGAGIVSHTVTGQDFCRRRARHASRPRCTQSHEVLVE